MICYNCMKDKGESSICPYCQSQEVKNDKLCLQPGNILNGRYIIGKALARGGFGIVYVAFDQKMDRKIAIKEYLPSKSGSRNPVTGTVVSYSGGFIEEYEKGLKRFIEEAQKLAKYNHIPSITDIYDVFSANNTAYIVMELLEGQTVKELLKEKGGKIPYDEAIEIILPVLDGLEEVHKDNVIHRDISPDNIFITNNGEIKLLDFGASRYAATGYSKSLTDIVKPGYSPIEQYSTRGNQGPWSDIYGICSTLYRMITGVVPQASIERKSHDKLQDPSKIKGVEIDLNAEITIMNGLIIDEENRPYRNIASFRDELFGVIEAKRIKIITAEKKHKRRLIFIAAATLLVAMTFGILAMAGLIIKPAKLLVVEADIPDNMVNAPNLIAKPLEEVIKQLKLKSLQPIIIDKQYDDNIPAGMVTLQNPFPGRLSIKGQEVQLVVSMGSIASQVIDERVVPDFEYQSSELAQKYFRQHDIVVKIIEQESNIIAYGKIIKTEPTMGQPIKVGDTIKLMVSKGRDVIDVPDVINTIQNDAEKKLIDAGFMTNIKRQYSPDVKEGNVLSQDPSGRASSGALVTLVISLGRGEGKYVDVPDISNMSENNALNAFSKAKLSVTINRIYDESIKEGFIISQDPAPGTALPQFSMNNVVVSMGQEPIMMVDVVSQYEAQAISILESLELEVEIKRAFNSSTSPGTVISQSPEKGATLHKGEKVTVTINNALSLANLIGKPQKDAIKLLTDKTISYKVIKGFNKKSTIGDIIAQTPVAGNIKPDTTVEITFNDAITIPGLIGKSQSDAIKILTDQKINYKVIKEFNRNHAIGVITSQTPLASNVKAGTTVEIIFNDAVKFSSLDGKTEVKAKDILSASGLPVVIVYEFNDNIAKNQVISYTPSELIQKPDTTITLTISKGRSVFTSWDVSLPSEITASKYIIEHQQEYKYSDYTFKEGTWTEWSPTQQSGGDYIEERVQFSTSERHKNYIWSTDTSISGWTATGENRGSGTYTAYSSFSSWSTTSQTETTLKDVETKNQYAYGRWQIYDSSNKYLTIHFCKLVASSKVTGYDHAIYNVSGWSDTRGSKQSYTSSYAPTSPLYFSYDGARYYRRDNTQVTPYDPDRHAEKWTRDGHIYYHEFIRKLYRYRTRSEIIEYRYWQYSDFSTPTAWENGTGPNETSILKVYHQYQYLPKEYYWTKFESCPWSTEEVTANSTRKVQVRTVHRYRLRK